MFPPHVLDCFLRIQLCVVEMEHALRSIHAVVYLDGMDLHVKILLASVSHQLLHQCARVVERVLLQIHAVVNMDQQGVCAKIFSASESRLLIPQCALVLETAHPSTLAFVKLDILEHHVQTIPVLESLVPIQ
jgi:hypothetical protein